MVAGLLDAFSVDERVVDMGCGDGRLAGAFAPERYLGLDLSWANVQAAAQAHPGRVFSLYTPWSPLPPGLVLAWTVLLHVPDDQLEAFVQLCAGRWVVIGEIMDRRWRRPGRPPVFNRDAADYSAAFRDHRVRASLRAPSPAYAGRGAGRDDHYTALLLEPAC
jgi:trans-aconitate methyltransferase